MSESTEHTAGTISEACTETQTRTEANAGESTGARTEAHAGESAEACTESHAEACAEARTGGHAENFDRICAVIHLDRIAHNMRQMAAQLPEKTGIIGVVKADGYGHGAVRTARAIDKWVIGYAAAAADEALELRRNGISKPILVLGSVRRDRFYELLAADIRPAISTEETASAFSALAEAAGVRGRVHLAVDTGMSRIGFRPDEASLEAIERIGRMKGIFIEGIFTHFARADERDKTATEKQFAAFRDFCGRVSERLLRLEPGREKLICHCLNSAGIVDFHRLSKGMEMDAARAGISVYGLYPSDGVDRDRVRLLPAMELKSRITYIKEIAAGTAVSYGGTFVAERPMRVATVCAGYGDGYPRGLSGRGQVLIRGKRADILGRVCMDQFMADVSHIPEAEEWDEVTLLGRDGNEEITMEELAEKSGGFHYEIPCLISRRVPRIYVGEER